MQKTGRHRKHSRERHPTRRAITGPTGVRLAENAQRLHPFGEVRGPSTNFSGAKRQQEALQTSRAASTFGRIPRGHDRKFDLTLDAALCGPTTTLKKFTFTSTKAPVPAEGVEGGTAFSARPHEDYHHTDSVLSSPKRMCRGRSIR